MKSSDGRFEYFDKDENLLPDGHALNEVARLEFACRSQKDARCGLNVVNAGPNIAQHNWTLTGTVDAPTIAPSINCEGCWHGFIEQGEFRNTSHQKEARQ